MKFKKFKIKRIFYWSVCFLFFSSICLISASDSQEEELLKLLPPNSKIAEIPIVRYRSKNEDGSIRVTYQTKKGIINVDVTGDGKEEIIVAYYTPPHNYYVEKNGKMIPDENFFQRARVVIFETTENGLKKCWESDGFGNIFDIQFLPLTIEKERIEYPWYIFGVKDIDNDGFLELAFSRSGYTGMGGRTEIWAWDGKKFVKKLVTSGELCFAFIDKSSTITAMEYYAGEIYITHFFYDKSSNKYKLTAREKTTLSEYLKSIIQGQ